MMPGSPKGYDMPFNSYGVSLSRSLTAAETISGTRNPKEPFAGNTDVSGDIVVPVDLIAFGYWLRGLFGAPTTTPGEESAPNTHLSRSTTISKACGSRPIWPQAPATTC